MLSMSTPKMTAMERIEAGATQIVSEGITPTSGFIPGSPIVSEAGDLLENAFDEKIAGSVHFPFQDLEIKIAALWMYLSYFIHFAGDSHGISSLREKWDGLPLEELYLHLQYWCVVMSEEVFKVANESIHFLLSEQEKKLLKLETILSDEGKILRAYELCRAAIAYQKEKAENETRLKRSIQFAIEEAMSMYEQFHEEQWTWLRFISDYPIDYSEKEFLTILKAEIKYCHTPQEMFHILGHFYRDVLPRSKSENNRVKGQFISFLNTELNKKLKIDIFSRQAFSNIVREQALCCDRKDLLELKFVFYYYDEVAKKAAQQQLVSIFQMFGDPDVITRVLDRKDKTEYEIVEGASCSMNT